MPAPAGRAPTAAQFIRLQPVPLEAIQSGNGGGIQALTTTETDLLGCTVTFSTATAATCTVEGTGHFLVPAGSAGIIAIIRCAVDGVTITSPEMRCWASTTGVEITAHQSWKFTVSGAGSHTVKLRGLKTGAGGTVDTGDLATRFLLYVFEVV